MFLRGDLCAPARTSWRAAVRRGTCLVIIKRSVYNGSLKKTRKGPSNNLRAGGGSFLQTTFQQPSNNLPTTFQQPSNNLQTTFQQQPSNNLPEISEGCWKVVERLLEGCWKVVGRSQGGGRGVSGPSNNLRDVSTFPLGLGESAHRIRRGGFAASWSLPGAQLRPVDGTPGTQARTHARRSRKNRGT